MEGLASATEPIHQENCAWVQASHIMPPSEDNLATKYWHVLNGIKGVEPWQIWRATPTQSVWKSGL